MTLAMAKKGSNLVLLSLYPGGLLSISGLDQGV